MSILILNSFLIKSTISIKHLLQIHVVPHIGHTMATFTSFLACPAGTDHGVAKQTRWQHDTLTLSWGHENWSPGRHSKQTLKYSHTHREKWKNNKHTHTYTDTLFLSAARQDPIFVYALAGSPNNTPIPFPCQQKRMRKQLCFNFSIKARREGPSGSC